MKKLCGLAKSEGCKFAKIAKDQKCFVGNLKLLDKDGELDIDNDLLETVSNEFVKRAPNTILVLVTTSYQVVKVHVTIPNSFVEFTKLDLLKAIDLPESQKSLQEGEYLKYRDFLINKIFSFFQDYNLLQNDDSSDEYLTFDSFN